jgi:hypothetical protein
MQPIKKVIEGVASREVAARGGYCGVVFGSSRYFNDSVGCVSVGNALSQKAQTHNQLVDKCISASRYC